MVKNKNLGFAGDILIVSRRFYGVSPKHRKHRSWKRAENGGHNLQITLISHRLSVERDFYDAGEGYELFSEEADGER